MKWGHNPVLGDQKPTWFQNWSIWWVRKWMFVCWWCLLSNKGQICAASSSAQTIPGNDWEQHRFGRTTRTNVKSPPLIFRKNRWKFSNSESNFFISILTQWMNNSKKVLNSFLVGSANMTLHNFFPPVVPWPQGQFPFVLGRSALSWQSLLIRPSATVSRISLLESHLHPRCHGRPPPLAGWPPPQLADPYWLADPPQRDGWLGALGLYAD